MNKYKGKVQGLWMFVWVTHSVMFDSAAPWTILTVHEILQARILESENEISQSCPTLCDPMDCSPPGSSVHGIFQARILERVAISFSRRSSKTRDWTQVSRIVGRRFTVWVTKEAWWGVGRGCHFLLQRIFPTWGSIPSLLHWRRIFYLLSHQGSWSQ